MTTLDLEQTIPEKPKAAPVLLRPHEVREHKEELRQLEAAAQQPAFITGASKAPQEAAMRRRKIKEILDTKEPQKFSSETMKDALAAEKKLRDEITSGMPTQAEMRRNPPGAIDKLRAWEARNKPKVLKWKNLRLRLHASGETFGGLERDVANIEVYRPRGGAGELSMDNAQIPGKSIYIPGNVEVRNVMSDDEREGIDAETLELTKKIKADRDAAKQASVNAIRDEAPEPAPASMPPMPAMLRR
jgi:hypothetical protein